MYGDRSVSRNYIWFFSDMDEVGKQNNRGNKKRGLAYASLVLSIIGGYPLASTASLAAIACGHMALHRIKKKPDIYSGKRIAVIGLVLGYLGLILGIVLGILRGVVQNAVTLPY